MSKFTLSFEEPIKMIESELKKVCDDGDVNKSDLKSKLKMLKKKLYNTKRAIFGSLTPWQRVQIARHPNRPHCSDYIDRICTDFIELHGDRKYADDPAIISGFAKISDFSVMIIGTQKGRSIDDNVYRNFGSPQPEGYRKALRFMKLAERARVPIITIIDTPGAYPGVASEERHVGEAIANNLMEMFNISVPIISVIIGEGGSGGALGIGIGNKILMLEHAYYSVITPEGCSAILWPDKNCTTKASELLKITGDELLKFGIVDEIIKEPLGGAHNDYNEMADELKNTLSRYLNEFEFYDENSIIQDRLRKYRDIGKFVEI